MKFFVSTFLCLLWLPQTRSFAAPDFVRDVQPIFKANCVECHNATTHKAGLRLDNRGDALGGSDNGAVIVPGHADQSPLVARLTGAGDVTRMPFKKPALPVEQVATLKAWIDAGAEWPAAADGIVLARQEHWAFVRPTRPALPALTDAHDKLVRNPIDRFILARLEKEKLEPSTEASREILIRRLSLDLIGLPPTVAEVDAFVHDPSPEAYEKVVDRLLASPRFGEKWARRWLDLARYADSNGYEKDRIRSMWPYRDWVIDALNADMPFDQFVIKQLAGDLLPSATLSDRVATGFNRNTMLNEEGGVDPEEYRYYTCVDRVNTTATVFLAATMQCAQCHNHKFDPYTQKDYYQFLAYFNSTVAETEKPAGGDPHDLSARVSVDSPKLHELESQLATLQAKLDTPTPQFVQAEARWEAAASSQGQWVNFAPAALHSESNATLAIQPDGSILASGASPAMDAYQLDGSTPLSKLAALRLEALPDPSLPANGPGRAGNGNFVLSHIEAAMSSDGGTSWTDIPLRDATADFSQDGWPVAQAIDGKGEANAGWGVSPQFGRPHSAVFQLSDVTPPPGTRLRLKLQFHSSYAQHVLGHFRISFNTSHESSTALPPEISKLLATPAQTRSTADRAALVAYYRSIDPELKPIREQIEKTKRERDQAREQSTVLVMRELPEPRKTSMHLRGAYLSLGAEVEPGTPALFRRHGGPLAPNHRQTRLDLAQWIVGPDNPLTARVTVNRIWEEIFGTGIVRTSEDFGTQGERPSHPELLDWLAVDFVEHGWSQKAIIRQIVTSATYRQSADVTPQMLEVDPADRLLERSPRYRWPAEMLRDQSLAASGLLSAKMGGPAVFPLQPAGVWNVVYSGDQWNTSTGEDRYRRGIYTMLRRSAPYPAFVTFDMTSREAICPRRSRTNTPLQALTLLNDPASLEPAEALAIKVFREGGSSDDAKQRFAFRTVLSREPSKLEAERLGEFRQKMISTYQADPAAAKTLLQGLAVARPPETSEPELAAWTMTGNVLLNLDETLNRP